LYGIGIVEKDYGLTLRPLTIKFLNSEVRQSFERNGLWNKESEDSDVLANNCKKLISHLPLNNSPILEGVPLLPPLPTENDMVEEMLDSLFGEVNGSNIHIREAFKMGYNKAKESFIYTEADMSKAIDMAQEIEAVPYTDDYGSVYSPSEIMDEINQPKLPVAFAQQGDTWQGRYLY